MTFPLIALLLINGFLSSTASQEKQQQQQQDDRFLFKDTTAERSEFSPRQHCPACLAFAITLAESMSTRQLRVGTPKEKLRYAAREDRVQDIIEEAVMKVGKRFTWVEDDKVADTVPEGRGRYWDIDDLLTKNLPKSTADQLKEYKSHGGSRAMHYFIRTIASGNDEAIENVVKGNQYEDGFVVMKEVCVKIAKICKDEQVTPNSYEVPLLDSQGGEPEEL
eukprot:PhF_6_TR37761/c0_g1_i1/m.56221